MIRRIKFIKGLFRIHRHEPHSNIVTVAEDKLVVANVPDNFVPVAIATPRTIPPHRQPGKDEPLAFCDHCHEWTPMQWRPKADRGKKAETWFQCEYCGGLDLTLRYLTMDEAVRRNACSENRITAFM